MKLTVDLTTANTVFYPLGPQGQWICHRFGRRNYPDTELDCDTVMSTLSPTAMTDLILECVYGDPLCYSQIDQLLKYLSDNNIKTQIHSYLNQCSESTVQLLNALDAHLIVTVSGIHHLADTVHQNADWENISRNLRQLTCKKTMIFHMYQHNLLQIPEVEHFCKQHDISLTLLPGTCLSNNFSSIINQQGKWLYDVYAAHSLLDTQNSNLSQSMEGYHALKKYHATPAGKSILDQPMIFKTGHIPVPHHDHVSVAVTGHVFKNVEHMQAFTNALCPDWRITKSDVVLDNNGGRDQYMFELSALLNLLVSKDYSVSVYTHSMQEILEMLSNNGV